MAHDPAQVRVIGTREYKAAALALAEAFADDHVARYFFDTPARAHWTAAQKWQLHLSVMEYVTYEHCMRGLVTVTGEDYGCVALWMPPGTDTDGLWTLLRSGMWRLYYKLCAEGRTRFFTEFLPLLHDTKVAVLGARDTDSYYLVYLGTKPAARGKGLAKKNVQHVLGRADAEGKACYLESSSVTNVPIYRKMGFEVARTIKFVRGERDVPLDIMVREPRGIKDSTKAKEAGQLVEKKAVPLAHKPARLEFHVKTNTQLGPVGPDEKGIVRGLSALATLRAD